MYTQNSLSNQTNLTVHQYPTWKTIANAASLHTAILVPKLPRFIEQLIAKIELIDMGVDVSLCRSHQYIFLLELIRSAKDNNIDVIDILQALINGGKSFTISNYLYTIMQLSGKDGALITCFNGTVVEQFQNDILSKPFIDSIVSQMSENETLLLVINGTTKTRFNKNKNSMSDMQAAVRAWSNGKIDLTYLGKTEWDLGIESANHTRTIVISTVHSIHEKTATILASKLTAVLAPKDVLTILDEAHIAFPCTNEGTSYGESTGHKGSKFYATYFAPLKALGKSNKILGITGTPTKAHRVDTADFKFKDNLITKEEIRNYSKQVTAHVISDEMERMYAAIDHTIAINDMINRHLGTKDKVYTTLPIFIPSEYKDKKAVNYVELVRDYIRTKHQKTNPATVAAYFGTKNDTYSYADLVDYAEDENNPLMFIVVKMKFSAGVNIKNIAGFCMVKNSVNAGGVMISITQTFGRGIRPNNTYIHDPELHKLLNICVYFIDEPLVGGYNYFITEVAYEAK